MAAEENKAVVRRYNEITQQFFQGGDVNGFDEVCAPDLVHHGPAMMPRDLAGLKQMAPAFRAAFPDIEIVTEDLVAEGDRVVDLVTVRGTHQGEFMGIPPTGKPIEMQEIHIARIVDGKIVERWTQFDVFGLLHQIGGIPAAPEPATA
jgi:predicted ester cyclase